MPSPTVTSISPSIGGALGGASVTLTGTNFTGTIGVTIGGVAATSVVVVSATSITCITPANSSGAASVVVTNGSGSNSANTLYLYVQGVPTDTYIYLKGGRGDAKVPLWTGIYRDDVVEEKSEPYRNEFQTTIAVQNAGASFSTGFGGSATLPGNITTVAVTSGVGPAHATLTPNYAEIADSAAGVEPRQFSKRVTWRTYVSSNGLPYPFRLAEIIGIGYTRRDE